MKLGIFLPNWIGDAVMATPALRALRDAYPHSEHVAILRPYVGEVLAGVKLVDRQINYQPKSKNPAQDGSGLVKVLKQEQFDMVLLLPNSFRTASLAWRAKAKHRVGLNRDGRGFLLTDKLPSKSKTHPHPAIDEYRRLAAHVISHYDEDGTKRDIPRHIPSLSREMELATLPDDAAQLANFWARHQDADRRGVICLNPGGAFGAAKHWPVGHFAELAARLTCRTGKTVLVLCGPAEVEEAREIVRRADHPRVFSFAEEPLSIGLTKAAVKNCDLLITTDSGPRHFAPPFDVPVVTLFGPTHIAWSETFYENQIHLQLDVDCGPCQKRVCPLSHHKCMRDLSVERVYQAALNFLSEKLIHAHAA